ncbi:Carboxypeptidase A4 [Lunasporangiospora selenospora]|uniref:Carboxypeptidase M14A n=1 Tax=Lunasporangiospora selenospora TaxID=979761 RepID=A0A9P6KI53_9FUNG|nr:Carboxypeptidase A4 [Lunasporangiospora selenospora]
MRRQLWTTVSLALSILTALSLTSAQNQLDSRNDLLENGHQQRPFMPRLRTGQSPQTVKNNAGGYARFDGEKVLRVQVSTYGQLERLTALVEENNLDLWSPLRIGAVDVRVPASLLDRFGLQSSLDYSVMIPNLQDLIPDQPPSSSLGLGQTQEWNFLNNTFWENYHDLATINKFMETLSSKYPKLVKRVSIGKTHEGREIFGLSIHGYKRKKKRSRKSEFWNEDMEEEVGEEEVEEDDDDDDNEDDENLEEFVEETVDDMADGLLAWIKHNFGLEPTFPKKGKKPSRPKKNPKAIVIHAGLHAREWIGPAVVTYLAKELTRGYKRNKKITRLVNRFEFVLVPLLNADGYVYTWEQNRMWRKNRQPTSIEKCPGIDPNRNWGYQWTSGGVYDNPCNEGYQGPEAFASHEAKMMADYIQKRKNVVSYIDFHAYSQLWLTPFGVDCDKVPKDDEDITEAAMGAAKALHTVHGKRFAVGSVCNLVLKATGGSIDWTYAVGKVKYSYEVQLRDTGRYGFLLPESEILPSSEETFAAILYLANFIRVREKQWG